MKKTTKLFTTAALGFAALGLVYVSANNAVAADAAANADKEKCYGVVKAGANDCANSAHSCAGHSEDDATSDEWIFLPKGVCERLAGGSTVSE